MKLTIWQQFSSNNSAHFTIVGVFRSPEDAESTAQQVRSLLEELYNWYVDNPEEAIEVFEDKLVTEIEQRIANQYQVEWRSPVLWGDNYTIEVFDRFILAHNNHSADSGADPIDQFIRKLGADEVFVNGSMIWDADERQLKTIIQGIAPDIDSAKGLLAQFDGTRPGLEQTYIDQRLVRVQIEFDQFLRGEKFKTVVTRMREADYSHITVEFEESRGYTTSL